MQEFFERIASSFDKGQFVINNLVVPVSYVSLAILIFAAAGIHLIAVNIFLPMLEALTKKTKTNVDEIFANRKVFKRAFHLIPAVIMSIGMPMIPDAGSMGFAIASKTLSMYYILIIFLIFDALLTSIRDIYNMRDNSQKVGITGIMQALKVTGLIVAVILAISQLVGKSPIFFISGLGAFTAILMLIFKDPLLGLVAGVQLSAMDLVRKGDWIEIPKHGADGAVVDITLTTVKVQNWDRTFTAVPAYELIASSFKNWRGMFDGGGRRIKRYMRFSLRSVRFLTDEELESLRKIKLISSYIDGKIAEIDDFNAATFSNDDLTVQTNGRRLTNIGTYRAYCDAYLKNHQGINQNLIVMVRQLQPTEFGLPLEIYAFTSDVRWVAYENTQSDIFDHLIAIISEFGLELYQR